MPAEGPGPGAVGLDAECHAAVVGPMGEAEYAVT